jgi:hypothetical protein
VKDIVYEQDDFIEINLLEYHGLKQAIKAYMLKLNITINTDLLNVQYPIVSCFIKPIIITNSNKKYLYETFVRNTDVPTSKEKWNAYFIDNNINWSLIYSYVFKCTK